MTKEEREVIQCGYCGVSTTESPKSHIIPNSLCTLLKDKNNDFHYFSKDLTQNKKTQTGPFDKSMLCFDCEKRFNERFDNYGVPIMKYLISHTIEPRLAKVFTSTKRKQDELEYNEISKIDTLRFYKFLLSILWRANLSKHPFFQDVSLGPFYEEKIKETLGSTEVHLKLPCDIMIIKRLTAPYMMIKRIRVGQTRKTVYNFSINNLMVFYTLTGDQNIPYKNIIDFFKIDTKDNFLNIPSLTEEQSSKLMDDDFGLPISERIKVTL